MCPKGPLKLYLSYANMNEKLNKNEFLGLKSLYKGL
jgi:hypothetical protein